MSSTVTVEFITPRPAMKSAAGPPEDVSGNLLIDKPASGTSELKETVQTMALAMSNMSILLERLADSGQSSSVAASTPLEAVGGVASGLSAAFSAAAEEDFPAKATPDNPAKEFVVHMSEMSAKDNERLVELSLKVPAKLTDQLIKFIPLQGQPEVRWHVTSAILESAQQGQLSEEQLKKVFATMPALNIGAPPRKPLPAPEPAKGSIGGLGGGGNGGTPAFGAQFKDGKSKSKSKSKGKCSSSGSRNRATSAERLAARVEKYGEQVSGYMAKLKAGRERHHRYSAISGRKAPKEYLCSAWFGCSRV